MLNFGVNAKGKGNAQTKTTILKGFIYMKSKLPQKRITLNNNTINEIHSAFPPQESVTGKSYKATLDYITTEIDFFEEKATKDLVKNYGLAPIGFYELLRIEMAKSNGYGICITNDDFNIFTYTLKIKLNIDEETVNNYVNLLTEYKLLHKIKDEDTDEEYYTTLQSIWNYEYRLYYRYTNREKQKKNRQRKKKTEVTSKDETLTPTITIDSINIPDNLPFYDDNNSSDFTDIDFDDLPFD